MPQKTASLSRTISAADLQEVLRILPPLTLGEELGQLCELGQKICYLIYRKKQNVVRMCGGSPEQFRKEHKLSDPALWNFNTALVELGHLHEMLRKAARFQINMRSEIVAVIIRGQWHIVPLYRSPEEEGYDVLHTSNFICNMQKSPPLSEFGPVGIHKKRRLGDNVTRQK